MLRTYLPAIVLVLLGGGVGGAFAVLNSVAGPKGRQNQKSKADPYECGLPSEVKRGFRFGISFYLVAMLFILFDVEVIFLYPVAVHLKASGAFVLGELMVFVALLAVAFVFVWRRGALEWR
jgi:NADH-quinone oxidoreductase subunit A